MVASGGDQVPDDAIQLTQRPMASDDLPQARFEVVCETDTPASPPAHIEVGVSTFWSILRNESWKVQVAAQLVEEAILFEYCPIIAMKIPSSLPRDHYNYQAMLTALPQV